MSKDNRKPFDLERAKAGDPIETRNGRKAVFGGCNLDAPKESRIAVWVGGSIRSYCETGKYVDDGGEYALDLFMAPKKVTVWVNIYSEIGLAYKLAGFFHTNKIAAEKMAGGANFVGTYPLEIDVP